MSLSSFLLPKYLKFDKTQPFIFITSLIAFLGIAIGVMVLCVAMAIMNGVTKELQEKIFIMNAPLNIKSMGKNAIPKDLLYQLQVQFPHLSFSPYLQSYAMIKTPYGIFPTVIFGIDSVLEGQTNPILQKALRGEQMQPFHLVMGEDFYNSYGIQPDEKIVLFFTDLSPSALSFAPTMKRFEVKGFFHSGIRAYDRGYSYTSLESLAKIKGISSNLYDGIHIDSANPMQDYQDISKFLTQKFQNRFFVEGWWHQNGNLFSAMELEKRALFIVLLLIILMASLNIISSLLMVVMNRRKEIALLLSMGASKAEIKRAFFAIGITLGFGGIVLGFALGFGVMEFLSHFPIISLPADVYGTTKLPLDFSWLDGVMIAIGSVIIVCFSSYYPAHKASQVNLLEVLRNE
ncbi:ABC transporter permease [Helicobacter pametensis]|uniref:ABC transporter permease n=1 Tax=Helicobacter pametensis TaxID=95149 RepID=UPI000481967C|nr:ABC transporter permease [Helicobacter pametensis]